MKTRKLVLIIADVLLLAVCIVQFALSARDTTKYFTFKDEPDSMEIVTPGETISLVKEGDNWVIGDKKYPANISVIDGYVSAIKNIRALDKVGSTSSDAVAERYELVDGKKTIVTAKLGDKVLRTLEIGKTAVSSSQCYATVDGGRCDKYCLYHLEENGFSSEEQTKTNFSKQEIFDLYNPIRPLPANYFEL